jgi:hypothetical protein
MLLPHRCLGRLMAEDEAGTIRTLTADKEEIGLLVR